MTCPETEEHCRQCGRPLVLTIERNGYAPETGRRTWERWHSCPRYFGRKLVMLLTLGLFGAGWGHDSHSGDFRLMTREWR